MMNNKDTLQHLTRRELLKRASIVGASFAWGPGFLAATNAAWAYQTTSLDAGTFATLLQMARDIYPHDKVGDEHYVTAVKGYDTPDAAPGINEGIAMLDDAARKMGHASYLDAGWERHRVDVLRSIEDTPFFQQIRGGLVTGLYNNKAVWPIFGYEGESFTKGGYMTRGFNDINWL